MSTDEHDALVIGAGPSGLTAARDLRDQGHSVLVLEAHDRLGGRTYTRPLKGYDDVLIEVGGTYIHPELQHNLQREIQRYDQVLTAGVDELQTVAFHVGGKLRTMPVPPDEVLALERVLLAMARAAERVDTSADLEDQFLADLDVPIERFLAPFDVPARTKELLYGALAGIAQCDVHQVSMLQWLGWIAGLGTPVSLFFGVTEEKLRDGTAALWRAMADGSQADFAFDAPVTRVAQGDGAVSVATAGGGVHRAKVCVVAVGCQVLDRIEFAPGLPPEHAALIEGAYAAHGFKDFLVVEGAKRGLLGYGGFGGEHASRIGWIYEDRELPDGRALMIAWGRGPRLASTVQAAQAALVDYMPDAVVTAVDGHDWSADPYAGGINHFRRPGEALRFAAVAGRPHGDVLFAGGDVTPGIWNGWIEGAVDAGRIAAGRAAARLREMR